ncbi:MAG TPA: methyltransferase domain-containing protein [Abditibacteriaceae bacterium]|jgi:cyclopropane fatty-acyl-phospholipid synthase-like methyltransferase
MKTSFLLGALGIGAALSATLLSSREQKPQSPDPPTRMAAKQRDVPRQTAPPWTGSVDIFEEKDRDQTLQIQSVMDDLKLQRGSTVADIGAGGGWFSVRAARRVAPGTVYANEISSRYTQFIKERASREKLPNIVAVLGTPDDPKLPRNSCDAVLILNAYHEFAKPLTMLRYLSDAMKPGARLGFIERDDDAVRRDARQAYAQTGQVLRRVSEKSDGKEFTDDHRLAREIVWREAIQAGFRIEKTRELGGDNYFVVAVKPK